MEVMLRCEVVDKPGRLAGLAGTVGNAGGDIESVEVAGRGREGTVLDDLVVVGDPQTLQNVVEALHAHPDVRLLHAGPSRGHPGDAVTRLAIGLEALLTGSSAPERGMSTLVGGLLHASRAELVPPKDSPEPSKHRLLASAGDRLLVLERDYPFTDAERERGRILVRLCLVAMAAQPAATTADSFAG